MWISSLLDSHRPKEQQSRMSTLLSSGILGLFMKWDRIRAQSKSKTRTKQEYSDQNIKDQNELEGFQAQSMEDSNISLIFLIALYLSTLSALAFLMEFSWANWHWVYTQIIRICTLV